MPSHAISETSMIDVMATLPPTRSSRRTENSSPTANSSRMTPTSASVSVVAWSAVIAVMMWGPTSRPASR